MKGWYRFQNATDDPTVADIQIVDFIGDWVDDWIGRNFGYDMGVTAKSFLAELAALPSAVQTIRVHINSPGGDVFAAVNIANALRDQQLSKGRTVETIVDGLAASAASVIAMAGSVVRMADNALMMVHNPWTIALGEAKDMRKAADELDTVRASLVATYKWHSELPDADIIALMDATTWMDAADAVAKGFATETIQGLKAAASINPKAIATLRIPEQYRARLDALVAKPAPAPVAAEPIEVVRACNAAGCPEEAEALMASAATLDQVQAHVAGVKTARAAAAARATAIADICALAKQPELAAGYIAGQMSADDVKAHLVIIKAKQDKVEIDTNLKPDASAGGRSHARVDVFASYKALNQKQTKE